MGHPRGHFLFSPETDLDKVSQAPRKKLNIWEKIDNFLSSNTMAYICIGAMFLWYLLFSGALLSSGY